MLIRVVPDLTREVSSKLSRASSVVSFVGVDDCDDVEEERSTTRRVSPGLRKVVLSA